MSQNGNKHLVLELGFDCTGVREKNGMSHLPGDLADGERLATHCRIANGATLGFRMFDISPAGEHEVRFQPKRLEFRFQTGRTGQGSKSPCEQARFEFEDFTCLGEESSSVVFGDDLRLRGWAVPDDDLEIIRTGAFLAICELEVEDAEGNTRTFSNYPEFIVRQ